MRRIQTSRATERIPMVVKRIMVTTATTTPRIPITSIRARPVEIARSVLSIASSAEATTAPSAWCRSSRSLFSAR